ncbi:MAG: peptide ABC transporter substrate-binding protein [Christensenellaceae bacterium]|jgi:oligopeptide transport system substrate-binding protein|nr:peptide ABC transporter substrate-binding protein [Christensenellaceae bacterium]
MQSKAKKALSLLLALALFVALTACASPSPSPATSAPAGETAAPTESAAAPESPSAGETRPNILHLALEGEAATLDTLKAEDTIALNVTGSLNVGLYIRDADGVPRLALAESVDKSDDNLVFTYHLKDAVWSNGDPVTAHDFVFSWRELADPANALQYSILLRTTAVLNADEVIDGELPKEELGITAIDDKTLEVRFERPIPYVETALAMGSFFPVNEAFYKAQGDQYGTSPETTLSNGAFLLKSYQPSATFIEMVKNPDYVFADRISVDGLTYQVVKDSQQAVLAYENGDIDVVVLGGEQAELYSDAPEFTPVLTGALWYLSPNVLVPGLDNLNLRKALALSFDKEALVKTVLKDGSVPADYIVTKLTHITADGADFRDLTKPFLEVNKELAKEYWQKAPEELGVSEVSFTLLVEDNEATINASQYLQAQIQENLPGVTITIEQMPKKNRVERMAAHDYELALTRWGPDYSDATTFLDLFLTGSTYNYGSWSNAEFDRLEKSASDELINDIPARLKALQDAEQIIGEDAAVFPVYQKANAYLIKPYVKGIEFTTTGTLISRYAVIEQ